MPITSVHQLQTLIRARRHALGLTQQEVADRAMVSRKTISEFETGKASSELSLLFRLLAVLDLTFDVRTPNADEVPGPATAGLEATGAPLTTGTVDLDHLLEGKFDA